MAPRKTIFKKRTRCNHICKSGAMFPLSPLLPPSKKKEKKENENTTDYPHSIQGVIPMCEPVVMVTAAGVNAARQAVEVAIEYQSGL